MTSPLIKKAHLFSMNIIQAWPVIVFILMAVTFLSKTAGAALIQGQINESLEEHSANPYSHEEIAILDKQQAIIDVQAANILDSIEDLKEDQYNNSKKIDRILEYIREDSN